MSKPLILILGATGLTGQHLLQELDRGLEEVDIRVSSRNPDKVAAYRREGKNAVLLDLDDPSTFALALAGVDWVFLLTGYTVAMLAQSKTLIDAARKAGVKHTVHLGTFGNWDCTDPHFAWHQLIETYIEASGIARTHLHPNVFMELLATFMLVRDGSFPVFWGDQRVGWIAAKDVAAAAAAILCEGPEKHHGKNYWLSAEVAGGQQIAEIMTNVLGSDVRCDVRSPDDFVAAMQELGDYQIEPWYAAGTLEFLRQVADGRMGYIG